jgi:hypothetical protein
MWHSQIVNKIKPSPINKSCCNMLIRRWILFSSSESHHQTPNTYSKAAYIIPGWGPFGTGAQGGRPARPPPGPALGTIVLVLHLHDHNTY